MRKILFNDKYGLTDAVLQGCKTMTRRIIRNLSDFDPRQDWIHCYYNCGIDVGFTTLGLRRRYGSARSAFAALIDKFSGKGTWERNPYVFAYTFELVK